MKSREFCKYIYNSMMFLSDFMAREYFCYDELTADDMKCFKNLEHIDLAYYESETELHIIQISCDLIHCSIDAALTFDGTYYSTSKISCNVCSYGNNYEKFYEVLSSYDYDSLISDTIDQLENKLGIKLLK